MFLLNCKIKTLILFSMIARVCWGQEIKPPPFIPDSGLKMVYIYKYKKLSETDGVWFVGDSKTVYYCEYDSLGKIKKSSGHPPVSLPFKSSEGIEAVFRNKSGKDTILNDSEGNSDPFCKVGYDGGCRTLVKHYGKDGKLEEVGIYACARGKEKIGKSYGKALIAYPNGGKDINIKIYNLKNELYEEITWKYDELNRLYAVFFRYDTTYRLFYRYYKTKTP